MRDVDWGSRVSRLPDEDLFEIVSSGDAGGFEPQAIEAATAEIGRRKLSTEAVTQLETLAQERQAAHDDRATEPLTNGAWIAFLLFGPVMVVTLTIAIFFFAMGQRKKGKEALWAIFYSFLVWWVIAMIVFAIAAVVS